MVDAFSQQDANSLGMTKSIGIMASEILHKSCVEMTEEGPGMEFVPISLPIYENFHCSEFH